MNQTSEETRLLDTVIGVAIINRKDKDKGLQQRLSQGRFQVSAVTVGELRFGAYKSQNVSSNLRNVDEFIALYEVLAVDEDTAAIYGRIKQQLRAKGRPIPENDMWIAATALQYGLILVTRDAHFGEVDGLRVERW